MLGAVLLLANIRIALTRPDDAPWQTFIEAAIASNPDPAISQWPAIARTGAIYTVVEGFDIVKGPADVVYGPTGNVGGYVNLVTKRPYFDTTHATATVTDGEFGTRKWQLDVSGPVSDQLAYRVSDIDALSERLREDGVRLLYDAPRRGTGQHLVDRAEDHD